MASTLTGLSIYKGKGSMKIMKVVIICIAALQCSCSMFYSARPTYANGSYYMAGDAACRAYSVIDSRTIYCLNDDGERTGRRSALTDQQLQMYRHNQNMAQSKSSKTCYKNAFSTSVTCY